MHYYIHNLDPQNYDANCYIVRSLCARKLEKPRGFSGEYGVPHPLGWDSAAKPKNQNGFHFKNCLIFDHIGTVSSLKLVLGKIFLQKFGNICDAAFDYVCFCIDSIWVEWVACKFTSIKLCTL